MNTCERWNHKVRMNDEVVILGICRGSAEETNRLLDRLNGRYDIGES
ncbi:MAG: hypothetical protein ACLVAW_22820 [Eisenbergiella massiliensis]